MGKNLRLLLTMTLVFVVVLLSLHGRLANAQSPRPVEGWGGAAQSWPDVLDGRIANLHMTEDAARPLFASDADMRLDVGPDGVLSVWIVPRWDDEHCEDLRAKFGADWPKWKFIYSNASASTSRFEVALHCDRRQLLVAGSATDSTRVFARLDDGKPHHLVLRTSANGTVIHVDGQEAGLLPVSFGSVKMVPAIVGDTHGGLEPFLGTIAGLRVWRGNPEVADIESVSDTPVAEVLDTRLGADLVGFMVADGDVQFQLKDSAKDITGTWIPEGTGEDPQSSIDGGHPWDRSMKPKPVYAIVWTDECSDVAELVDRPRSAADRKAQAYIARVRQGLVQEDYWVKHLYYLASQDGVDDATRDGWIAEAQRAWESEGKAALQVRARAEAAERRKAEALRPTWASLPLAEQIDAIVTAAEGGAFGAVAAKAEIAEVLNQHKAAIRGRGKSKSDVRRVLTEARMATDAAQSRLEALSSRTEVPTAPLPEEAGVDPDTCSEPVLAVMASVLGERPVVTLMRRVDPVTFAALKGGERLVVHRDGTLAFGRVVLERPRDAYEEHTLAAKWGGDGGLANMDFNSRAFDFRKMEPNQMDSGTDGRFLFAMTVEETGRRWTSRDKKNFPSGLALDARKTGCDGQRWHDEILSERDLAQEWTRSFSFTIANVTKSEKFTTAVQEARRLRQAISRTESRCERYVLYLNPARAPLSRSFRRAVESLKRDGHRDDCRERVLGVCRDALDTFIGHTGTHYANAITYGGRAIMEVKMDEETYNVVHTAKNATDYSAELETTVTVGAVGQSLATNFRFGAAQGFVDERTVRDLERAMSEHAVWQTFGGNGSPSFEGWSIDDHSGVVPIYYDLKLISDLLAPPFFTDAAILGPLRDALEEHLRMNVLGAAGSVSPDRFFQPKLMPVADPPNVAENAAPPVKPDKVWCWLLDPFRGTKTLPEVDRWGVVTRGEGVGMHGRARGREIVDDYVGKCFVPTTGESVRWSIYADRESDRHAPISNFTLRPAAPPERRVSNGGVSGRWIGKPTTDAGRQVQCTVSDLGGTHETALAEHFTASNTGASFGNICHATSNWEVNDKTCGTMMGNCVVSGGSADVELIAWMGRYVTVQSSGRLTATREVDDGRVDAVDLRLNYHGDDTVSIYALSGQNGESRWVRADGDSLWAVQSKLYAADRFKLKVDAEGWSTFTAVKDGRRVWMTPSGVLTLNRPRGADGEPLPDRMSWFLVRGWNK